MRQKDKNKGYKGYSMSKRADLAYDNGEMPATKWTKPAIIKSISEFLQENGMELLIGKFGRLTRDDLFNNFYFRSSWHHTSKCCNLTDFYKLDREKVLKYACGRLEIERNSGKSGGKSEKVMTPEEFVSVYGFHPRSIMAYLSVNPDKLEKVVPKSRKIYVIIKVREYPKRYIIDYDELNERNQAVAQSGFNAAGMALENLFSLEEAENAAKQEQARKRYLRTRSGIIETIQNACDECGIIFNPDLLESMSREDLIGKFYRFKQIKYGVDISVLRKEFKSNDC